MKMKQYYFIKYCYFHKLMTRAFTLKILIALYLLFKDKEFYNSRAGKSGCK